MVLNQQKTWKELDDRIDYLMYKADKLLQTEQNIKQAGVRELTPEEKRHIRQAAVLNNTSDRKMLDTMFEFMQGDSTGGYQPPAIGMLSDNPQQSNLKQAGISNKKNVSDIEMLKTFMEFGRLS
jgi:hypothetical protein